MWTFTTAILLALVVVGAAAADREKRSDDLNTLEVVLQQQSQLISQLSAKVAALEAKEAKGDTQVAFQARPSQDPFSVIVGNPVIFDVIITNIGNGYDRMSGIFTAPVSGVYVFHLTCMDLWNANAAFGISLIANGATVAMCYSEGTQTSESSSTQTTVHLLAGQKVFAASQHTENARGSFFTTFGGVLVTPDVV